MFASLAEAAMSLDIGTLFVIAICVTSLLGLFLLFAWLQDRITALAWWGTAYLIGGFSGVMWRLGDLISPPVPSSLADVLLFIAVGMIWSAARLFHGRPVLWGSMCVGAAAWLAFCSSSAFVTHGDVAADRKLADRRHLYVPDRRRAVARAAQIADPALAGDLRADAARRRSSCFRWHWRDFRKTASAAARSAPAGSRSCHRGHALRGRRRLHRAGAGQGSHREPIQAGGRDRSVDRTAQPPRLLRSCRRHHVGAASQAKGRSACSPSTSIISSRSTIGSATIPATPRCTCSPPW